MSDILENGSYPAQFKVRGFIQELVYRDDISDCSGNGWILISETADFEYQDELLSFRVESPGQFQRGRAHTFSVKEESEIIDGQQIVYVVVTGYD